MPTTTFGGQSKSNWGDNTLNPSETMRDLLLFDTTGAPRSTADARKKGMLVLAFVKPSDATSQRVLSALQRIADGYQESGKVTVWAVSEESGDATTAFAQRAGITFPLLLDRDLYHAMSFGVVTFPTVYLADGGGYVQSKVAGWHAGRLNALSEAIAAFAERDVVPIG